MKTEDMQAHIDHLERELDSAARRLVTQRSIAARALQRASEAEEREAKLRVAWVLQGGG